MKEYKEIITEVMEYGVSKEDRTGTGTTSVFNINKTFDLKKGFPLVTGKFTPFKTMAVELLWFLAGGTNVKALQDQNCHIWDDWADNEGELGPVYGKQWRNWERVHYKNVDQIKNVIQTLRTNPDSRRMIVSAWNVGDLGDMALSPCHYAFEFYTKVIPRAWRIHWARNKYNVKLDHVKTSTMSDQDIEDALDLYDVPKRMLSCKVIQRSCDTFLGVPFNIASYALLTHLIAHCTGMLVDNLHWSGGDVHIYKNHFKQVDEYLAADTHELPEIVIADNCPVNINDITLEHFSIKGYKHSGKISAPVSV